MNFGGMLGKYLTGSVASSGGTSGYAAIGGALLAGGGQIYAQEQANQANKKLAREQMAFQERMSNTAHQREVMDLLNAGLNPNLSAGGNGSSTPSGASATMQAPTISLPDFMSYGVTLKQLEQQDERIAIERANSAATISKSLTEEEINKMKKVLMQKGMVRADLEGSSYEFLQKALRFLKNSYNRNNSMDERSIDDHNMDKVYGPLSNPMP
ncbi:DNA pilot protein [Apis mellifera associated microvirus 33]|nr:DNA pilot protein [Apis mellifera associated microvirus 33]